MPQNINAAKVPVLMWHGYVNMAWICEYEAFIFLCVEALAKTRNKTTQGPELRPLVG